MLVFVAMKPVYYPGWFNPGEVFSIHIEFKK